METNIVYLIFITLGVFIVPFISPLVRLPVAVGELLFGAVLALFLKGKLTGEDLQILGFLSFLGFSLLMFIAGLEIDWNKLEDLSPREKLTIGGVVITNFVAAGVLTFSLRLPPEFVLILGAFGIGLMITVLQELKIDPKLRQILVITGSVGEIMTLLLLTGYDIFLTFGLSKSLFLHLGLIALFGTLFVLLLKILKFLVWLYPRELASLVRSENKAAIDIRASFALMLLFMSFTSLVHIEPILGAFIAGTLLGFVFRDRKPLEEKLAAFGYGFLIPFFFVQVGFEFDLHSLDDLKLLKTAAVFGVLLFLVKFVSSLWFKVLGFRFKDILLGAFLFSFPFTILIALGKILYEKGIWKEELFTFTVLLTVLTGVVYPFFIKLLFKNLKETL
jgi:Kef-type K+ transport system membrane component KefB